MIRRIILVAVVVLAVLGVGLGGSGSSRAQVTGVVGTITPGPPPHLGIGCPSPPGAQHGIQIWIHVIQWCDLPAVRGQAQFKLQMEIYNRGRRTLGIGQEHMRLIVADLDLSRWSPPRDGSVTTEQPFQTTYLGRRVWAVPANAEDAYDPNPMPGVSDNLTFATHWGQSRLAPGATFRPSFHSGDLVFYVPYLPHDPHGLATEADVLGIAYVYGREIVVMCPKEHWGHREPAPTF